LGADSIKFEKVGFIQDVLGKGDQEETRLSCQKPSVFVEKGCKNRKAHPNGAPPHHASNDGKKYLMSYQGIPGNWVKVASRTILKEYVQEM